MSGPVLITSGNYRDQMALRGQLQELLAIQRTDATPSQLARIYATCVTAYRAANLRATVVANVPFRVVDRMSEPVTQHPLVDLVTENPLMPDLVRRSELTMCFWGHNLLYKRRQGRRGVTGMQWINPNLYQLHFDPVLGTLDAFDLYVRRRQMDDGEGLPEGRILRADGIYMHGVDFDNDFDGVSPAEAAFDLAGIETEAAQTAVWFLRNRAVPAAILQPKDATGPDVTPPDDAAQNAMKRLINRILQGARNAGKTIVSGGRWEWVPVQHQWDQIHLGEQVDDAREGIAMAFEVPLDLLIPTSSTFAELYQSDKSWVEYFAKNQCRWYARQLNLQLTPEFGDDVRLEPDFDAVFTRNEREVVEVTNQRLQGGYITLYQAQVATGDDKPRDELRDIYLVGGEPMHLERLVHIAREGSLALGALPAQTVAPNGDSDGTPDKLPPSPASVPQSIKSATVASLPPASPGAPDSAPATTPDKLPVSQPAKSATVASLPSDSPGVQVQEPADWLPDDMFKELRDCTRLLARRGLTYDFHPAVLPVDVVAYVRLLLASGDDPDTALAAGRAYIHDRQQALGALRAFSDIERPYRAALYDLIAKAFARSIDRGALEHQGYATITQYFEAAFKQGLLDVGVPADTLEPGEAALVREQTAAERGHFSHLSASLYSSLMTIQDQIRAKQAELRGTSQPDEQERLRAEVLDLKRDLIAARDGFLKRVDLWVQGLNRIYSQGQLSGQRNKMMRWNVHPKKEHCRTCAALDGQVHRASAFQARGLYPGSKELECVASAKGVPVCGCGFENTTDRASGRLDRVPRFGGARSLGLAARSEQGEPSGTAVLYLADTEALVDFQSQLMAEHPALDDVRWTPVDHLHLTLVHSPLVVADAFADIFTSVQAAGVPTFELRTARLDAFEVGEDHRAIVLLLDALPELRDFQRQVCDEFRGRDIPLSEYSEPQAWTPHITLGYERSGVAFAPSNVDLTVWSDRLAFTRGDYVIELVTVPSPTHEVQTSEEQSG